MICTLLTGLSSKEGTYQHPTDVPGCLFACGHGSQSAKMLD